MDELDVLNREPGRATHTFSPSPSDETSSLRAGKKNKKGKNAPDHYPFLPACFFFPNRKEAHAGQDESASEDGCEALIPNADDRSSSRASATKKLKMPTSPGPSRSHSS